MEFAEEGRQVRVVGRVQVRVFELVVVLQLLMQLEAAGWTVAFLRRVGTEEDHALRVVLAVGGQLLHDGVDDGVVEVEGDGAHDPHARLPPREHVGLQGVGLGDELHRWQNLTD